MSGSNPGDPPDDPDERGDHTGKRGDPDGEGRRDSDANTGRDPDGDAGQSPDANTGRDPVADAKRDSASGKRDPATANRESTGTSAGTADAAATDDRVTIEDDGVVHWFLKSNDGNVVFVRDILSSVAIVAVIGLLLFALSGVWPPLVAVESGSMEPDMERGDLIFVIDEDRYVGDDPAGDTGIVPLENGVENGHERFGQPGDVIIFQPNGDERQTPIIHRAHFWVEEDENWVDTKADEEIIGETTCDDLQTCPANHDGFITKGDANNGYDQQYGSFNEPQSEVVDPDWVTGKARFGIPWLGHIRLTFDSILGGMLAPSPVIETDPAGLTGLDSSAAQVGLVGTTGAAGATGGIAVAVNRYRD
ncbi:S24/S26 family peptidase [Natronorubrum texcoconense]|uniref:Signal peptidase, endoplasmic reticulum-type n=1 Tax=Natronorubrum texcoconense TaxID=1095776 RepID=A0A1G9H1N7_9EURY|nr:S26 family signal peptidase [Natronorubrum texcoconense]SDK97213.1 signal peptidase, endoplasmic reticulum-type [Natronorubrum texcoconense]SDL06856.1 signal peptidase, endoplasmic reticulum-type [Natronorubrum texcoconense]